MSNIEEKLASFELHLMKLQVRWGRRSRFRLYRKLESMLSANESLSRALDRLYQNVTEMGKYPNRPVAVALREWFLKDRAGISLSQAMEGWAPLSELYLIRAGEESGALAAALGAIRTMNSRGQEMRQAVMHALGYPAFMAVLVGFVIWTFSVNLISNMRANAPANVVESMGAVVPFSDFVTEWGAIIVLAIIAFCILIASTMSFWTGSLRARFDKYPPWSWYRVLQGSGFLMGLSALLGAQVPLKKALEILEEQGSPWMRERLAATRQNVLRGHNLGESLRMTRLNFPSPEVAIDLEILSERSDVNIVIEQVADEWMQDQVDSMRAQAAIIRNIGMAIVGTVIGWTMMSIFSVVGQMSSGGSNF